MSSNAVANLTLPLLSGNAAWAVQMNATNSTFLPTLAEAQAPPVVWIGCADSRVPESVITNQLPGQIFTTRNIGNQFHTNDDSAQAVVEYGIGHLNASNVVVVGHTNCGGVKAAYAAGAPSATDSSSHAHATHPESADTCSRRRSYFARSASENSTEEAEEANDPLNNFLAPLIDLRRALPANATVLDLTVANVRAGVIHVINSTTIQDAWAAGREVCVHGWLYDLASGLIQDLGFTTCSDSAVN